MKNFNNYSKYYDTIYASKNYKAETDFVLKILKKYGNQGRKLLSLGCGTCTYEILMAKKKYRITGIDRSKEMLDIASKKIKSVKLDKEIQLFEKDIRRFSFKKKFDNAMAMFNIAGYQTQNEDFENMLRNVSKSLKKGGLFIFDCWYMPAVLKDRPTDRVKNMETKKGTLTRLTKSLLKINENIIEINFDVILADKNKTISETIEIHHMRYWSLPEVQYFLTNAGFSVIHVCNFMDDKSSPSENNWNMMVVAKK